MVAFLGLRARLLVGAALLLQASPGGRGPAVRGTLGLPVVALNPDRPPSDAVALARHGVALELMSGAGHFPVLEAPERFDELLAKTVERLPRPERALP